MKANELPITNFLQAQNIQFIIPVYQRNYDWTNNECKELINDVIAVEKYNRGTHFIGSIVFIHEGIYSTSEVKELVIIDGQQRLTTINIIYVALFRFAKENSMQNEADMLFNMFLTNQYVQHESSKLKLKQTDTNSLAFKAIMNGTENEFNHYSNVIENFNYFKSIITQESFHTILNGLKRLIFVEISLERGKDDPQRIFESLNSTGLDLSQSDLIRNYILMDLDPKNQNKIFEQIWNPIEENARDLIKQKSLVSEYIRDYLTLRTKKIPNKNKVYIEFKKLYSIKDEAYNQELENIKSLSIHYKKFINPSTIQDHNVRRELEYISRLEINVAFPFLLQVFEDAENGLITKEDLIKILKLIQSYTWRRFVVGLPTNALNKIFMTLYSEVDTEEYYDSIALALIKKRGSAKFPTDEDLKTALKDKDLYNIQSKNRNYMFELLENYNNREYVNTANENITIEHIFPQTPNEDWNKAITPDDYFMFKEKYVNTIANLTLSGNNGALSNKSFKDKRVMNRQGAEQGYNFSRLWLNDYLKTIDKWDVANYNERFNLIYTRFLKIWEYPDIIIPFSENTDEQNLFNAESPTHKKLEYFIFENTKVDEEVIAQMYFYVIEKLYEKNAQLLLEAKDIFKITRNASEFRAPQELQSGYFIESNIDSNSKFSTLKKLLPLFEIEDELVIKYSDNDNSNTPKRYHVRKDYWKQLLPLIEGTELFSNVNPSKDSWITAGAGLSGLGYAFVATSKYVRIELAITSSSKEKNKKYFKKLLNNEEDIENRFGNKLEWEELPENKMSRIKYELQNVNLYDKADWNKMNDFLIKYLPKFEKAFLPSIKSLK
ncbi:Uncharacterized conserved protein, contains ParB-like and HNH nuclease domains [Flaviramulus basaltis]|uniref:Uncharacterized conserved protein, contains ParB-like and HNH nuclease domains n=1 Tax=Flaviramulus basaltis TaxID=369401 RepID=A0A1K2IQC0_9FLAO|nr:DUF4268 domain-containing protein [Flaviramulus basaltis]SFZ94625.1 Uncharacterized conserved protein, contains ParB-like and HNH nuclease domains [Flaviramulus basaltis]